MAALGNPLDEGRILPGSGTLPALWHASAGNAVGSKATGDWRELSNEIALDKCWCREAAPSEAMSATSLVWRLSDEVTLRNGWRRAPPREASSLP